MISGSFLKTVDFIASNCNKSTGISNKISKMHENACSVVDDAEKTSAFAINIQLNTTYC